MALLSSCWFIIESIIIRDGLLKWSYMNVYINPVFVSLCQVLVWLSLFYLWLLRSFRQLYDAILWVLMMFHKLLIRFVPYIRRDSTRFESNQEMSISNLEVFRRVHNSDPVFYSHNFSIKDPVMCKMKVLRVQEIENLEEEEEEENESFAECEDDDDGVVEIPKEDDDDIDEMNVEKGLELECKASPMDQRNEENRIEEDEDSSVDDGEDIVSIIDTGQMNSSDEVTDYGDRSSSFSASSSAMAALQDQTEMENQTPQDREVEVDENDELYEQYSERMRWYDILNQERTMGLSMIMNQKTARRMPSWDKRAEKRLRESIERDLELVYVAQTCLSWEALQHQYMKVRETADSRRGFRSDLCGDFQRFQVLLERFLEDERCDQKRVMRFVQRRFELMSFLQVPKISGHIEGGKEETAKERKEVGAKEVMKAIEKCIEVFNDFVKLDMKTCGGKLKSSILSVPVVEVEDPREIKLFVALTTSLQKKEQWLKEIQGKNKKHWLKRKAKVKTMKEFGEQEMLLERFTVIDLKLVSRVLQLPLVSSSHLKWCQHKLDNIHFKDGNISRTLSPSLFPSS